MSELFDLRNRLTAADVRQDKIEIVLGTWIVSATNEVIIEFIRHLGRADRSQSPNAHRVFNLDNSCTYVGTKRKLKIITRSSRNFIPPLFSGHLQISKINHDSSNNIHTYTLKLFLSINPTRYCVHQRKITRSGDRFRSPTLFSIRQYNSTEDEHSLDGNDNVAIDQHSKINLSSYFYRGFLQAYIENIEDYLLNEIETFNFFGFEFRGHQPSYSIQSVENYWDIDCDNPTLETGRIRHCFTGLSNNNGAREYRTVNDGASLSLICTLRKGETLKIYAKTNRKLRVEITHKYIKNPYLLSNRRYEVHSMEELLNFLIESENEATEKSNYFITRLYAHANHNSLLEKSPLDFVTILYEFTGNIDIAQTILIELVTNGGFSRTYSRNIPTPILTSLKNAAILRYEGRPISRYVVHPRFRNAVDIMTRR